MINWKNLLKKNKGFPKFCFALSFLTCLSWGRAQDFQLFLTSDSVNITCYPYKVQVRLGDDLSFVKQLSCRIRWNQIRCTSYPLTSGSDKAKKRFLRYLGRLRKALRKGQLLDDPSAFELFYVQSSNFAFFVLKVHRVDEPVDSPFYQFAIPVQSQKWLVKTWGLFYDYRANLRYDPGKVKFMGYFSGDSSLLESYCDYQVSFPFRYRVTYFLPVHEQYFFYDPETASGGLEGNWNLIFKEDLNQLVTLIRERKIPYYDFSTGKRMRRKSFYQLMGKKEEWEKKWSIILGMEVEYEVTDDGRNLHYKPLWIAPIFFNQATSERFPTIMGGDQFSINEPVKEAPGYILYRKCRSALSADFCKRIEEIPLEKSYLKILIKANDAFPLTIEESRDIQLILQERRYSDLPSHYSQ